MTGSAARTLTTGIPGLDRVLRGLLAGDNVVWQVDSVDDYRRLVEPFCAAAAASGRSLTYFHFAGQPLLLDPTAAIQVRDLDPRDGFEAVVYSIHDLIEQAGRGAHYVFDCLSDLAGAWHSDEMLANFFLLICPHLFDLETVTYFGLLKGAHSDAATRPIAQTAQVVLDVYRHGGTLYMRPVKVQHRFSPTMYMLHAWEGPDFKPVTASVRISEIVARGSKGETKAKGTWERAFLAAEELLRETNAGRRPRDDESRCFERLARMVFSRDRAILDLASRYLSLADIVSMRSRLIGTGLIGGKAVGMLLAGAILKKEDPESAALLEEHDSFYVASDVFYTFLVANGVWWAQQRQRDPERFLEGAEQARQRILAGSFPQEIVRQLEEMIDYFGQSPFIVRSSSLLEDNFGNAFAGKYESVFCANQGPRERRTEDFLAAVRTIYASTMGERALSYRADRGLLGRDEQMALLVMRVSGDAYGRFFYPPAAGVGYSFNPYVWSPDIDPRAGVLRLVFGLGTRAVERNDDDYTRLVALNAPNRRPEQGPEEARHYAQRRVDTIDLDSNQRVSGHFLDVLEHAGGLPVDLLVSIDNTALDTAGKRVAVPYPGFDGLLSGTEFVADMRRILATLQGAYRHPVDVEFTVNFPGDSPSPGRRHRINVVQCRPLQVKGSARVQLPPVAIAAEDRVFESCSALIGHSRKLEVTRLVYVSPSRYGGLPPKEQYEVARLVGEVNRALKAHRDQGAVLLGPGRWGSTTPSLGVPVTFAEINAFSVLCEIVAMRENLAPDVSLGTHFINDLVELDMLYVAVFPADQPDFLSSSFFESSPNFLLELVPSAKRWNDTVRVVERSAEGLRIALMADAMQPRVVCFVDRSR